MTLSLGVLLISAALYWKVRPLGLAELSLLPLQLALLLLGAFTSQSTVTLLGTAAWSATLALARLGLLHAEDPPNLTGSHL